MAFIAIAPHGGALVNELAPGLGKLDFFLFRYGLERKQRKIIGTEIEPRQVGEKLLVQRLGQALGDLIENPKKALNLHVALGLSAVRTRLRKPEQVGH